MELVKQIGSRRDKNGKCAMWGLFKCPICGKKVERIMRIGIDRNTCSKECGYLYKINMNQKTKIRGNAFDPNETVVKRYEKDYRPKDCRGCGYWDGKDGCAFSRINGFSRIGYLKGRTCREAGVYTRKKKMIDVKLY